MLVRDGVVRDIALKRWILAVFISVVSLRPAHSGQNTVDYVTQLSLRPGSVTDADFARQLRDRALRGDADARLEYSGLCDLRVLSAELSGQAARERVNYVRGHLVDQNSTRLALSQLGYLRRSHLAR